jgi:hypothetical protein
VRTVAIREGSAFLRWAHVNTSQPGAIAMDFGIFIPMQQRNKHKTSHQILRDAVAQTRVPTNSASAPPGTRSITSATTAAVTRKIRLGTGIVVAPLYTPARLIADVAMVDQLSNGRFTPCFYMLTRERFATRVWARFQDASWV